MTTIITNITLDMLQAIRNTLSKEKTSNSWLVSAIIANRQNSYARVIQDLSYALHWAGKENNCSDAEVLAMVIKRLEEFKV